VTRRPTTTAIAHAIQKMFTYMNGPPSLKKRRIASTAPPFAAGAAARTASTRWLTDVLITGANPFFRALGAGSWRARSDSREGSGPGAASDFRGRNGAELHGEDAEEHRPFAPPGVSRTAHLVPPRRARRSR